MGEIGLERVQGLHLRRSEELETSPLSWFMWFPSLSPHLQYWAEKACVNQGYIIILPFKWEHWGMQGEVTCLEPFSWHVGRQTIPSSFSWKLAGVCHFPVSFLSYWFAWFWFVFVSIVFHIFRACVFSILMPTFESFPIVPSFIKLTSLLLKWGGSRAAITWGCWTVETWLPRIEMSCQCKLHTGFPTLR